MMSHLPRVSLTGQEVRAIAKPISAVPKLDSQNRPSTHNDLSRHLPSTSHTGSITTIAKSDSWSRALFFATLRFPENAVWMTRSATHSLIRHYRASVFGGSRKSRPSPASSETWRPGMSGLSSYTGTVLPVCWSISRTCSGGTSNSTVGQAV